MNCPVCKLKLRCVSPQKVQENGQYHTYECCISELLRQLAAMTARYEEAVKACRAVCRPAYTTQEAYAMCEAVVAEADKETPHARP